MKARYALILFLFLFTGCHVGGRVYNPASPDQGLELTVNLGPIAEQKDERQSVRPAQRATNRARVERSDPQEVAPRIPALEVHRDVAPATSATVAGQRSNKEQDRSTAETTSSSVNERLLAENQTDAETPDAGPAVTTANSQTVTVRRSSVVPVPPTDLTDGTIFGRTGRTDSDKRSREETQKYNFIDSVLASLHFTLKAYGLTWTQFIVMVTLCLLFYLFCAWYVIRMFSVRRRVERQRQRNELLEARNEHRNLERKRENAEWQHSQQREYDRLFHQVELASAQETLGRTNQRMNTQSAGHNREQAELKNVHLARLAAHRREQAELDAIHQANMACYAREEAAHERDQTVIQLEHSLEILPLQKRLRQETQQEAVASGVHAEISDLPDDDEPAPTDDSGDSPLRQSWIDDEDDEDDDYNG